jgi:cation diffusion facilitator CzcD-associated flavoprotein CzcO
MTAALEGDERLCKVMVPDFPLGCRRLTPAVEYLTALRQPNVSVITDPITQIEPGGIRVQSGDLLKVDAIVCATGFNVSFRPRFPIIGARGNLQDTWSEGVPKAYMSFAVPGFPNYFSQLPI